MRLATVALLLVLSTGALTAKHKRSLAQPDQLEHAVELLTQRMDMLEAENSELKQLLSSFLPANTTSTGLNGTESGISCLSLCPSDTEVEEEVGRLREEMSALYSELLTQRQHLQMEVSVLEAGLDNQTDNQADLSSQLGGLGAGLANVTSQLAALASQAQAQAGTALQIQNLESMTSLLATEVNDVKTQLSALPDTAPQTGSTDVMAQLASLQATVASLKQTQENMQADIHKLHRQVAEP